MRPAEQRVAVVTGASAGIGKATVKSLAAQGWRVIGVGRDPQRTAAAEAEIRQAAPGATVEFLRGDFDLMSEVMRVAEAIAATTTHVDALINNAGGVRDALLVTAEGNEATFAANHLAPFLLTRELLPLLRASAAQRAPGAVRVLGVSSSAHTICQGIDWNDLQMLKRFTTVGVYSQAKLANILFTRELARRAANDGIVAQVMHPGIVDSNFASHGDAAMQAYFKQVPQMSTPEHAARTLVWLATSPEAGTGSGRYFHDCAPVDPAPVALDAALAARLWRESAALLERIGFGRKVA